MKSYFKYCIIALFLFSACSKDDGGAGLAPPNEDALRQTIENAFPFTANQNFEALYLCARRGSNLDWYFNFHNDGSLEVLFTTDTNQDFVFQGSYTYMNNQITIQMPGGFNAPFPNGLNETSRVIMPQFGLVAGFATDEMVAVCVGHGLNNQPPPRVMANYGCPTINVQTASSEENAIELVHRAVPTAFPVLGSIFRQQDIAIQGSDDLIIRRGFGIYRQSGNTIYATFSIARDFATFAQGQLPFNVGNISAPFDDVNIISGTLSANGQELTIDQLSPQDGPCVLR